jgi:hypothetical protein
VTNIASTVGDFFDSPQFRDVLAKLGGEQGLVDAYLAAMLGMVGIAASAYEIQAAMRLRAEENTLHAEQLLATAVGRIRWAASHITIAVLGTTLLMVAIGLGAGLAHGTQVGDVNQIGRVLGGALVQLPAAWVLTGIVVAAFGFAPRLAVAGWVALVGFLLLAEIGPLLKLNQWVMDLSPYAHVPKILGAVHQPATEFTNHTVQRGHAPSVRRRGRLRRVPGAGAVPGAVASTPRRSNSAEPLSHAAPSAITALPGRHRPASHRPSRRTRRPSTARPRPRRSPPACPSAPPAPSPRTALRPRRTRQGTAPPSASG